MLIPIFLFLFSAIGFAIDANKTVDKYAENDKIIKAVHQRGGLIFAVPPYWGKRATRLGFEKFTTFLGKRIGQELVLVILKDYEMLLQRTRAGDIDIGFYGPTPYIKVKELNLKMKYLATAVWKSTGKYVYYCYLVSKDAPGLQTFEELRGKRFAYSSRESTCGYIFPRVWMMENKIVPKEYFSNVQFLGRHDLVLESIAKGKIDAGVVSPGPLAKAEKKYGQIFRRVHKIGPIPASVIAVKNSLPTKIRQKIVTAISSLPAEVVNVPEFDYLGFKVLPENSYDRLQQVLTLIEKYRETE